MNVDTLLTRQMELHSSVRHPPKSPEQLTQLRETIHDYFHFFGKLKAIATQLNSDPETVFQCFMYISVGGAVSFDKQHQDGSVPMHQAKVLTRSSAIELEPAVRGAIPQQELMVFVGLSKDLRAMLRVKVEDGNDLNTAEVTVREAKEYLDQIYHLADGSAKRMFDFYMVEDPTSLQRMVDEKRASSPSSERAELSLGNSAASPMAHSLTLTMTTVPDGDLWAPPGGQPSSSPQSTDAVLAGGIAALPTPLTALPDELARQAAVAGSPGTHANARLKAAQTMLEWLVATPSDFLGENASPILSATGDALCKLAAEKRSALCRVGCNVIKLFANRLSEESFWTDHRNDAQVASLLTRWTETLCKGVYVTVAAISTATDAALRELAIMTQGHPAVVKSVLTALQRGNQTELRRKCLGYLALCVSATAAGDTNGAVPYGTLLVGPAQQGVGIGDSPSRKMARALCAVLRNAAKVAVPVTDPKVEKLIQMEEQQIVPFLGDPRELEQVLFERNNFVSSMRPSMTSAGASSVSGADSAENNSEGRPRETFGAKSDAISPGSTPSHSAAARNVAGGRRTVLPMTEGSAEQPLPSYPVRKGRQQSVPLSPSSRDANHRQASKKPYQLSPIAVEPARQPLPNERGDTVPKEEGVYDTSALLTGGADADRSEQPPIAGVTGVAVLPSRKPSCAHPRKGASPSPPAADVARAVPLSLRDGLKEPAVLRGSPKPLGAVSSLQPRREGTLLSPQRHAKSRSSGNRSVAGTPVKSESEAAPRISESLRRKIEGAQKE